MKKNNTKFIPVLVAVVGLLLLGALDVQDQEIADMQYCENVKDGTWGNYNPDIDCSGK